MSGTKENKKKTFKDKAFEQSIRGIFLNSVREIESLYEFYITYRDTWSAEKAKFETEYRVGIKINEVMQKISNAENPETEYEEQKSTSIIDWKFDDIIELKFEKKPDNDESAGDVLKYYLKGDFAKSNIYDPKFARSEHKKFDNKYEIFVRSVLSNIVIVFERYFSQVYEGMVVLNHAAYLENKTIKVSDLLNNSPMKLFKQEVIKLVDSNMFDTLETLNIMKTKSNFDIDRHIKIRKEFEEVYYRRNIFVHNAGIVNEIYLDKVDKIYAKTLKHGDKLICDDIYIQNALISLKKVIFTCYYEFINSNNLNIDLLRVLIEKSLFEALCNQEYDFCEDVYLMLSKDNRINFADKSICHINYMISLKQKGKSIEKMLGRFDVSAMDLEFKLAKECLSNNHNKVYKLLLKMFPHKITAQIIRDWPLYIEFRESEQYEKFKNEHIHEFNEYTFEEDTTENPVIIDIMESEVIECDEILS